MRSTSEEDYLKAIYSISSSGNNVSTTELAEHLKMKASSITDMIKKLAEKGWVSYVKYKGVSLTEEGQKIALNIIRKHRLWETFLVNELKFKWDEVHVIAEQLEHINAPELITRLDAYLGHPKFDPHGDPIPDADGNISDNRISYMLSEIEAGEKGIIIGVKDGSPPLLQYLEKEGMVLGASVDVIEKFEFDKSVKIELNNRNLNISEKVAENLLIQKQ